MKKAHAKLFAKEGKMRSAISDQYSIEQQIYHGFANERQGNLIAKQEIANY